jgi:uncharacterized protein (DUF1015 family)
MARVRPFAAYRYSTTERDISPLTAPPYDVISPEQRAELLAKDPHNVVALELAEGPLDPDAPANRYETAASRWDSWIAEGAIRRDNAPAVYVLEQTFTRDGVTTTRRAFIAEVGLEPFSAGVVLPHERTLPKALGDRYELIRATGVNMSQVLGLYEDPQRLTDALFESATALEPVAHAVDTDDVESTLWMVSDPGYAASLAEILSSARIFIADGHHRYTTALAYRDMRRQATLNTDAEANPAYDYVMMALVNMDDPKLTVMPTHRVADADGAFDVDAFWAGIARYFDVLDVPGAEAIASLSAQDRPAFAVRTRHDAAPRVIRLRHDVDMDSAIPLDRSQAWKELDVAILQELILDPLLGIHPDRPETLERLGFVKDSAAAIAQADEHDVAFVLRPTRMDQLRAVALAGETMPQKSTYFYPKLLSGLVFRSAE